MIDRPLCAKPACGCGQPGRRWCVGGGGWRGAGDGGSAGGNTRNDKLAPPRAPPNKHNVTQNKPLEFYFQERTEKKYRFQLQDFN